MFKELFTEAKVDRHIIQIMQRVDSIKTKKSLKNKDWYKPNTEYEVAYKSKEKYPEGTKPGIYFDEGFIPLEDLEWMIIYKDLD